MKKHYLCTSFTSLELVAFYVLNKRINKYHFWQDGCYTEVISSLKFFKQKLDYIHQNPVRAEFVRYPQDYLYSSAIDYAGGRGLLEVIVVR